MATPVLSSATINAAGTQVTLVWSVAVMDAGAGISISNAYRGYTSTGSIVTGDGTTTPVYSLGTPPVLVGETITVAVPANAVLAVNGGQGNSLTSATATNGSTICAACDGKASRMLVNTCTIRRCIESQSATSAGVKTAWGDAYTAVCCSVQGLTTSESEQWGTKASDSTYKVYLPKSVDINHHDRLTDFTGSSSLASTDTLEVVSDPLDHAGRGAYVMVLAAAVQTNG